MQLQSKNVKIKNQEISIVQLLDIADVKSGLGTGDNNYYLYKESDAIGSYRIVNHEKVLTEDELQQIVKNEEIRIKIINDGIPDNMFEGRTVIPTDKGGESDIGEGRLSNYYAPTKYYIDYSKKNVNRLRNFTIADRKRFYDEKNISKNDEKTLAAVIRNPTYYFKPGITFSDVGLYAPTYRINSSSVFDHRGNCIFIKSTCHSFFSNEFLLGIICSKFIKYIQKNFINNTVGFQVDDVKKIPVIVCDKRQKTKIEKLVQDIIKKQKLDLSYNYQKNEQNEIDNIVYETYGLDKCLIDEVENWYSRKYPKLVLNN